MRLVYLSPVPWLSFAQRPHKFVEWFRRRTGAEVLWVDPYPVRLPTWDDMRRLGSYRRDTAGAIAGVPLPPWLRVSRPRALPIEPLPGSSSLNRHLWRDVVHEVKSFSAAEATVLAIGKPSRLALELLDVHAWQRTLYDAMDDFPAFFKGLSRRSSMTTEQRVAHGVTDLWMSSHSMQSRWNAATAQARVVPNGLCPETLEGLFRRAHGGPPVFGYVGTIGAWFDWAWVVRLARAHPEASIQLIGPRYSAAPSELPGNVVLHPPCDHRSALERMQDFDVGLIPFARSRLTDAVDPIKYYEYKALGLAVLSTDFGEMSGRRGESGVFISDGDAGLSEASHAALRYRPNRDELNAFRRHHAWDAVFDAGGLTGT